MIDLDTNSLLDVRRILGEHVPECEAWIFGSRIHGNARRFSDLDIALVSDNRLEYDQLDALKDAFAESNLPFQVDVIDYNAVSAGFQDVIKRRFEILA